MKRKLKKLSHEPIGRVRIIEDFLPPPEKLLIKLKPTEVNITLRQDSIDFFKGVVSKEYISYQQLIRAPLDQYASSYK